MELYKLYNGEIELSFDPDKHLYTVAGRPVPGVTGVTGIIDKPALTWWAAGEAGRHWVERVSGGIFTVDTKTKKIERVKDGDIESPEIDEIFLQKVFEECRFAHRNKAKDAADIGTLAHNYIEAYIKHKLGIVKTKPTKPSNKQAKAAVDAYMQWEEANEVIYLESEKKIYSQKYKYAGTLDIVAKVNGQMAVVDLKTSTGIYPEMWLQTAAYVHAYQEELGIKMATRWIIRIGKDGVLETEESKDFEQDFRGFLGALLLRTRMDQFIAKKPVEA